ncbi:guanine nucleotide-binding protein [Achlya hypogyna]|uniref:Guanine nucleotide-binding protein n=1 Tax=Achlya hypogyna TaxID=1202772 RepID=A0A1V9Z345_ACHHY|nr:guanine nucleotide-binding protein [Achlya hypogyna]
MVKKKTKSKRLSLHKKYKILRKVREHKRQERKKERSGVGKKKKVPGIPNNWPFKEELLQQEEQARLAELANQERLKEQRRKEKLEKKKQDKLAINALAQVPTPTALTVKQQAKEDLKAVVTAADLVVIVLDARDPLGCRSLSLEDGLTAAHKDVVLVLNKVDLIARDTAEKWVTYLRRFHPTVAVRAANKTFKEATKHNKAGRASAAMHARAQDTDGLRDNGHVDALTHFLNEYVKAKKAAKVNVALVGYPNVGKSSLFNSLKRKNLSVVSAFPRTTKLLAEAQLGEHIALYDTPALDTEFSDANSVLMRHGLGMEYSLDPVPAVESVLNRGEMVNLMQSLQVPLFKSTEDFLRKFAQKKQMTRKGGDADILLAARTFLQTLVDGTVATMTLAPAHAKSRFDMPKWFAKVDTAALAKHEAALFASNPTARHSSYVTFKAQGANHTTGDTTEYDNVMGTLVIEDVASDDEDEDDDGEEAEDEDEAEEQNDDEQEDEEVEEEDSDEVEIVEVVPARRRSTRNNAPAAVAEKPKAAARKNTSKAEVEAAPKPAARKRAAKAEVVVEEDDEVEVVETPKAAGRKRTAKEEPAARRSSKRKTK